ncbi:MAG: hypothetical protein JO281_08675 [Pseudonocardiales bacterium]|nr:hypothetical protein [Pseudonocardiales bacterium]
MRADDRPQAVVEACTMTAERSHRFVLTGCDPDGRNRTIILWRETDLVGGTVVRRVVVTLDATMNTATILTRPQAIQVADALLAAAQ